MSSKSINLEPLPFRIAAFVIGGVLVMFMLLSANWFLGNAVASSADVVELAVFASEMSPGDPQTHTAAALMLEQSFKAEDLKAALKEAEIAVSLSPADYMLWQTLARLRERSGEVEGAEKALRTAHLLAPNNSAVQWALGNVLLRRNKFDESFAMIRKAVEGDSKFAGPAASIAWDVYEGDIPNVKKAIGNSKAAVSSLALYLVSQKRFDEAFEIYMTLPKSARRVDFRADSDSFFNQLMAGKRFSKAVVVAADLVDENAAAPKLNSVTDGGFENEVARELPGTFAWSVEKGTRPSIGVSFDRKLEGSKSIALLFDGSTSKEFRTISQNIAVTGGRRFTFSASYNSSLETEATMMWTITDVESGAVLATTEPIAVSSDGWRTSTVEFSVPEAADGVNIRLTRAPCKYTICPVDGAVWFDQIGIK